MKKAIQRAIKGGYKAIWDSSCGPVIPTGDGFNNVGKEYAVLDPEFWKCLGKAEGWKKYRKAGGMELDEPVSRGQEPFLLPTWQRHWHRLIDHIAEGKDIDSFFNNLLK